ncbi:MAG TPA: hypothetical protein VH520_05600 [Streptosporangiaceae bacterium]|jgi:hypothetical protein
MQRVLLIPARFTDWRMWAGIPDRLSRRAAVSHLDQLISLPWTGAPDAVAGLARGQAPGGWDVVVAAGQACPFAVALGAAGLARGIVLAEPEIPFDRIPEDVDVVIEPPDPDVLAPYEHLVAALHDADPEQWRALVRQAVRQTSPSAVPPAELDLAVQLAGDHAADFRAELLAFEAASAAERSLPDPGQLARLHARGHWLDQLAALTIPVVTVVPAVRRYVAETIGKLAVYPEAALTDGTILAGGAQPGARDQAAAAIERLLEVVGGQG